MNLKTLRRSFFNRNPLEVSKELLGEFLVRNINGERLVGKITEVEAYLGTGDLAAHARAGKTKRTQVLFGQPGYAYIFQTRHHFCLNVVTEGEDTPSCVLIRALEPLEGIEYMREQRKYIPDNLINLLNGPAKLCQAMNITLNDYGLDMTDRNSSLFIAKNENRGDLQFEESKRIGITKNADPLFRFTIKGSPFVSR